MTNSGKVKAKKKKNLRLSGFATRAIPPPRHGGNLSWRELCRQASHPSAVSGELWRDELLQLEGVRGEKADAFGQFFRGHLVFVVHPAERLFVERQFRFLAVGRRGFPTQLAGERARGLLQFFEQRRADGEQVATGQ